MNKHIGKWSEEHKRLLALGYRSDPNKIATLVNRLRTGEKPWQLYGVTAKDPVVSQDLGIKIGKDFKDGKLEFLELFAVDENAKAKRDPFRMTRYDIVKEAEEMAPYRLWNLKHMKSLRMDPSKAVDLLQEYDSLRGVRFEAEVTLTDYKYEYADGNQVAIEIPAGKAMKHFRSLPRYLSIHYLIHYRTEYPDAPHQWVERACELRVIGKLVGDDRRVISRCVFAADNVFRYQVWDIRQNLDSYFQGLARLSKTKASHEKFVKDLKKKFGIKEKVLHKGY